MSVAINKFEHPAKGGVKVLQPQFIATFQIVGKFLKKVCLRYFLLRDILSFQWARIFAAVVVA